MAAEGFYGLEKKLATLLTSGVSKQETGGVKARGK